MLHVPVGSNTFCVTQASWGTTRPATANGTSVTPSTTSLAAASWTSIITSVTQDMYGILININSNSASAASRNTVMDVGVDMSGGTSYQVLVNALLVGGSAPYNVGGSGQWYYFPILIPAGSQIAVRGYSTVTTAFRVGIVGYEAPYNPSAIRKGSFVETVGYTSGTSGTAVTPGTTTEGSWTLLGATTKRAWWWQVGIQVNSTDTSWTANAIHVDLAVGNGTSYDIIIQDLIVNTTTSEQLVNAALTAGVEWDVPSGSNIYIRTQNSSTADVYTAVAYGAGG